MMMDPVAGKRSASRGRKPKANPVSAAGASLEPSTAELRELLADIVESSSDAIFSRSLDGVITSWNAAAERIFGFRAKEILGQSGAILLPPDRSDEQDHLLNLVRAGQRVVNFDTVRLRKDRNPLNVSLTISPIRDTEGRIVGASSIIRDTTAQRHLEARLMEVSERERQRFGHDLHDGLGQQLGGIELLCRTLARMLHKKEMPEAEMADQLTAEIMEAISQTRTLARGLAPVIESADGLMLALNDFATHLRALHKIQCSFHCPKPVLLHDYGVAIHLYRIVQEATNNAIRHGHAKRIIITLRQKQRQTVLTIQDNGSGFRPPKPGHLGMGLHLMNYRSMMAGGICKIDCHSPAGTKVTCMITTPELEPA